MAPAYSVPRLFFFIIFLGYNFSLQLLPTFPRLHASSLSPSLPSLLSHSPHLLPMHPTAPPLHPSASIPNHSAILLPQSHLPASTLQLTPPPPSLPSSSLQPASSPLPCCSLLPLNQGYVLISQGNRAIFIPIRTGRTQPRR